MTLIPGTTFSDYDTDTPRMEAEYFCATLSVNASNANLTDAEFRTFVLDSLPVVKFQRPVFDEIFTHASLSKTRVVYNRMKKKYQAITFGLSLKPGTEEGMVWVRGGLLHPNTVRRFQAEAKEFAPKGRKKKR